MAKLYFRYGAMGSSKTANAIMVEYNYHERGQRVLMLKPRLDIYRCLADTYGLDVKRTMFIDDNPANIEAALLSGWHGLCFNRPGRLSRFIV